LGWQIYEQYFEKNKNFSKKIFHLHILIKSYFCIFKIPTMKTVSIGCDHAGYQYKERLKKSLELQGYTVVDRGTFSEDSVDYPDYAHQVAQDVEKGTSEKGILICGSGNGVNITANKHQNVRSALCWMPEIAELARLHNDANVIALPARFIAYELAEQCTVTFLNTEFEGGRHLNRVNKINLSC